MGALINTFNELAAESNEIIVSLNNLKEQSAKVKTGYAQMLSMTDKLHETMGELTTLAEST